MREYCKTSICKLPPNNYKYSFLSILDGRTKYFSDIFRGNTKFDNKYST